MSSAGRPVLCDLFCGAGGAATGFHRAGFDVFGVDNRPQPSYPFAFVRDDAVTWLTAWLKSRPSFGFRRPIIAFHASPPCKLFTTARRVHEVNRPTLFEPHENLIEPIRDRLIESGLPYVIENVPGAPLRDPVVLCGSMFDLRVRRHRLFETNWPLTAPDCRHGDQPEVVGVYGNGGAWTRTAPGGGGVKVAGADAAEALGIEWTARQSELAQAIPPSYTEFIGRELMNYLGEVHAGHAIRGRPLMDDRPKRAVAPLQFEWVDGRKLSTGTAWWVTRSPAIAERAACLHGAPLARPCDRCADEAPDPDQPELS